MNEQGIDSGVLRSSGHSAQQMKEGGYSARQLKEAGYSAQQLQQGGYPASDVGRVFGLKGQALHHIGYPASALTAYQHTGQWQSERDMMEQMEQMMQQMLQASSRQMLQQDDYDGQQQTGWPAAILQKMQQLREQPSQAQYSCCGCTNKGSNYCKGK
jgi:hypothetical protein